MNTDQHYFTRVMRVFAISLVVALPFDNALFHLLALLLFLFFIVNLTRTDMDQIRKALAATKWVHMSFLAIWVTMLISNIINSQSGEAWRTMLQFGPRYWLLFTIFSFLLHQHIVTKKDLFFAATLGLGLHFIPYVPNMMDLSIFDNRFQGMDRNPNTAGFKAAGLLMLSIYLLFYNVLAPKIRYPVAVFLGAMALIALLASGNRGSWVAIFVCFVILFVGVFPRNPKMVSIISIATLLVVGFVLTQFAGPADRLALLFDGYSARRIDVWQNAWQLFIEKPFFGYGLDVRDELLTLNLIYHEHNIYISVAVTMGITGLLAYTAMLTSVAARALEFGNHFELLMLLMMLIVGFFAYDFYRSQLFLGHFFILAASAVQQKSSKPVV